MTEDCLYTPDPHCYAGLLFIGDPHVAASPPGYRLDDYTRTILEKLAFSLETARDLNLLPVILGDLFHVPRNNPNSLLVDLIELFRPGNPFVLVGNHDKHEARLTRDVSLSVIQAARIIRLIDRPGPVCSLKVGNYKVLLGGSPDWTPLPTRIEKGLHDFVIWLTHHDLSFPGYDACRVSLKEIPGVDMVVNGHIHTPKPPQQCGCTVWFNPGSITRLTLSAYSRGLTPSAFIWSPPTLDLSPLPLPHRPFSEVFPELSCEDAACPDQNAESFFIKGLENLLMRKTMEGVGIKTFLEANLIPGDPVDADIWALYEEVMHAEK